MTIIQAIGSKDTDSLTLDYPDTVIRNSSARDMETVFPSNWTCMQLRH